MDVIIAFIAGLMIGGAFGMILMALLTAGSDDERN